MAQVLAASTLAIAITFFINFYAKSPDIGAAKSLGQISIALAAAAFALSLRLKSLVVAGSLLASGIIGLIPTVSIVVNAAAIAFPGPILGLMSYSIILGLGAAKAEGFRSKGNVRLVAPR
jgi:hypothetical protein